MILLYFFLFAFQSGKVWSDCVIENAEKGLISHSIFEAVNLTRNYQKCWSILNPTGRVLSVVVKELQLSWTCERGYLRVNNYESGYSRNFCMENFKTGSRFTTNSRIDVTLHFDYYFQSTPVNFIVTYEKANDMSDVRSKVTNWLFRKRVPAWGWKKNNPKSIIALYLSSKATFNGSKIEEELMVKQGELSVSAALLNGTVPNKELSTLINSMLVVCHSPYNFLGHNLVKRLFDQIENSTNFVHPINYLTLCNANMTWPQNAPQELSRILNNESEAPYITNFQAYAIMALSCKINQDKTFEKHEKNTPLIASYEKVLKRLEQKQLKDGSFGSIQTTALLTQALMTAGPERNWDNVKALNYLNNQLNSSKELDFMTSYLVLPLSNGKTLADIAKINCSGNPRNIVSFEPTTTNNSSIKIRYSLYIGDEKSKIHSLNLKVSHNSTAFEVMKIAESEDSKFKFEWQRISGYIYINSIAGIPNDPESVQLWHLYLGASNIDHTPNNKSPDKVYLQDGDKLVMWYRTAEIYTE